jgi:hypothetical protein
VAYFGKEGSVKISCILALCVFVACLGCSGGGGSGSSSNGNNGSSSVRFINTVPELPQILMYVGGSSDPIMLNYGELTNYISVGEGETVTFFNPSSPLALLSEKFSGSESDNESTYVVFGDPNPRNEYKVTGRNFSDVEESPDGELFKLRVINAAVSLSHGADVFVQKQGVPVDVVNPFIRSVSFAGASGYKEGQASVSVLTVASASSQVTENSTLLDLTPGTVATTILMDKLGRGKPYVFVSTLDN